MDKVEPVNFLKDSEIDLDDLKKQEPEEKSSNGRSVQPGQRVSLKH